MLVSSSRAIHATPIRRTICPKVGKGFRGGEQVGTLSPDEPFIAIHVLEHVDVLLLNRHCMRAARTTVASANTDGFRRIDPYRIVLFDEQLRFKIIIISPRSDRYTVSGKRRERERERETGDSPKNVPARRTPPFRSGEAKHVSVHQDPSWNHT